MKVTVQPAQPVRYTCHESELPDGGMYRGIVRGFHDAIFLKNHTHLVLLSGDVPGDAFWSLQPLTKPGTTDTVDCCSVEVELLVRG